MSLPNGYTQLEYIQSTGTQYIDSGITPNTTTKCVIKLNPQNIQESAIFGSSWAMNGYFLMFFNSKVRWHSASSADSSTIQTDTDLTIETTTSYFTVNGTTYNVAPSTPIASGIRIFSTTIAGSGGASNTKGSYKLYYLKIYDNDTLVRDFIPAKYQGVVGLYDDVSQTFFTNMGSGAFIPGPEISGNMSIILQLNNSEKNRVTKDITNVMTLQGTLRESTSIIDPVIKVAGNISDIADCNYVTIPAFKRSYFITNMRTIVNGIVEIACHVDVLSSFASEIKDCTAIIHRSENTWNLYLNDGSFRVYQNPSVVTIPFPTGFTTQQYILAIAGV